MKMHVAVSMNWGVRFAGVLSIGALLVGVFIRASDFGKLPYALWSMFLGSPRDVDPRKMPSHYKQASPSPDKEYSI